MEGGVGAGGWDFARAKGVGPGGGAIIGYRDVGGVGLDLRVAGTSAVTVVIEFGGGEVLIDDAVGQRRVGGFVAGLPIEAMRIRSEGAACVEVRLSPVRAYSVLGIAPGDLGRGAVGVDELFGGRVRRLREQLAEAGTWEERFALTNVFLGQGDTGMRGPDPEVVEVWDRIRVSQGRVRIGEVAEEVGWSHKRLWGRFEGQIGLTPKRAAMLVRFRHAVDGLLAGGAAAEVAVECGYSDQAHLCRDVAAFARNTPRGVAANHLPSIARQRHRAWGKFVQ